MPSSGIRLALYCNPCRHAAASSLAAGPATCSANGGQPSTRNLGRSVVQMASFSCILLLAGAVSARRRPAHKKGIAWTSFRACASPTSAGRAPGASVSGRRAGRAPVPVGAGRRPATSRSRRRTDRRRRSGAAAITDVGSGAERDYLYVWMHGIDPSGAGQPSAVATERVFDVLHRCGVRQVIVDNSTGGVAEGLSPWDLVIVDDLIDLSGVVPRPVPPRIARFGRAVLPGALRRRWRHRSRRTGSGSRPSRGLASRRS